MDSSISEIRSLEDLQTVVGEIRNNSLNFISNYYPGASEEEALISEGLVHVFKSCDSCLIFTGRDGFCSFSYAASCPNSLECILKDFFRGRDGKYVTDIVGREEDVLVLSRLFERCGFVLRRRLARMVKLGLDDVPFVPDDNIRPAEASDAPAIHSALLMQFDKYSEQIPSEEALKKLIADNGVFLYELNEKTVGMIIFEPRSAAVLVRFWLIDSSCRNQGIGSRLWKRMMYSCGPVRRRVSWVPVDNRESISRHLRHGYIADGLTDTVMTFNVEENER